MDPASRAALAATCKESHALDPEARRPPTLVKDVTTGAELVRAFKTCTWTGPEEVTDALWPQGWEVDGKVFEIGGWTGLREP